MEDKYKEYWDGGIKTIHDVAKGNTRAIQDYAPKLPEWRIPVCPLKKTDCMDRDELICSKCMLYGDKEVRTAFISYLTELYRKEYG